LVRPLELWVCWHIRYRYRTEALGNTDPATLAQHQHLDNRHPGNHQQHCATVTNCRVCAAELVRVDPSLRLPVAAIAFPALRGRPEAETRLVTSVLGELINADGQIDIFEYCLGTLVFVGLNEALTSGSPWKSRRQSLASAQNAICCLIAVLAQTGNGDPRVAAAAFQAGISVAYPQARIPFLGVQGVFALEQVWPVIDGLEGNDKATVVAAVVTTVTADGVITVEESELLRTVCGVLHCPVPPVV